MNLIAETAESRPDSNHKWVYRRPARRLNRTLASFFILKASRNQRSAGHWIRTRPCSEHQANTRWCCRSQQSIGIRKHDGNSSSKSANLSGWSSIIDSLATADLTVDEWESLLIRRQSVSWPETVIIPAHRFCWGGGQSGRIPTRMLIRQTSRSWNTSLLTVIREHGWSVGRVAAGIPTSRP